MKLVRYRFGDEIATGVLQDGTIRGLRGTFFEDPVPSGAEVDLDHVRLLAPVGRTFGSGRRHEEMIRRAPFSRQSSPRYVPHGHTPTVTLIGAFNGLRPISP